MGKSIKRTSRSKRASRGKLSKASKRSKASPTRGWRKQAPRSINSRRSLKSKCGSRCFLLPSEHKFPICTKNCKVSCKGLVSAKVRAAQFKYKGVYAKASRMVNSRKCTKKSRSM